MRTVHAPDGNARGLRMDLQTTGTGHPISIGVGAKRLLALRLAHITISTSSGVVRNAAKCDIAPSSVSNAGVRARSAYTNTIPTAPRTATKEKRNLVSRLTNLHAPEICPRRIPATPALASETNRSTSLPASNTPSREVRACWATRARSM